MDMIGEWWIKWPARIVLVAIALSAVLFVGQLGVDVFSGKDPITVIESE